MFLKCELIVHNRLAPTKESKKAYVTFIFSKKKVDKTGDVVCFTVYSQKKEGSTYMIKGNILQVHNRFIDQGMCTVGMKDPTHNLIISKAPVEDLKKFLQILKISFKGGDVSDLINLDNVVKLKLCDLENPKTTMTILTKTEYPVRESFPKTLESLHVSCALKKFDVRMLKLCQLKVLDLSDNKLSTLCESLDTLECLRNLHLANNSFQQVPFSIYRAETAKRIGMLDLSGNQIKYLPMALLNLKNLYTLKLDRNELEFLPSNFGHFKSLKCLHLSENKLKILPWSFSSLQLDVLDLSGNLFHASDDIQFNESSLGRVPSLFEVTARYMIKTRLKDVNGILPRVIQQRLESCKYCPCGTPCISHCVPYVKFVNLSDVAHSMSYDEYLMSNKSKIKAVGYLCSSSCHEQWLKNPNTLFTSRKRRWKP